MERAPFLPQYFFDPAAGKLGSEHAVIAPGDPLVPPALPPADKSQACAASSSSGDPVPSSQAQYIPYAFQVRHSRVPQDASNSVRTGADYSLHARWMPSTCPQLPSSRRAIMPAAILRPAGRSYADLHRDARSPWRRWLGGQEQRTFQGPLPEMAFHLHHAQQIGRCASWNAQSESGLLNQAQAWKGATAHLP